MVTMDYANVVGSLDFHDLVAKRGLKGLGCHITGSLYLQRAELSAPKEDELANRAALDLYRAQVGDIYGQHSKFYGGIYATGATVTRSFRLFGGSAWSRQALGLKQGVDAGTGVDLRGIEVGSSLALCGRDGTQALVVEGDLRLANASCGLLRVTFEQLTSSTDMEGLTYSDLRPITGMEFLQALDGRTPAPRRAYAELASFAEVNGMVDLQRKAMEQQQRRMLERRVQGGTGHVVKDLVHPSTRFRHWLYGITVGYGYKPGLALLWLVGCLVLATVVVWAMGAYIHNADGSQVLTSWPQAAAFTIDLISPFPASGYADQWTINPSSFGSWLAFYSVSALRVLAWVFGILGIGAVSGVIRSRS